MSNIVQHTDPNNIPEAIILAGGRNWTVKFKDGTSQDIFVHKQPFLEMEQLAKVWGNLKGELLCYTKREEEFIKQLTDASVAAVLKEGRALNFLSCAEYFSLQEQTMSAYGTQVQDLSKNLAAQVSAEAAKTKL